MCAPGTPWSTARSPATSTSTASAALRTFLGVDDPRGWRYAEAHGGRVIMLRPYFGFFAYAPDPPAGLKRRYRVSERRRVRRLPDDRRARLHAAGREPLIRRQPGAPQNRGAVGRDGDARGAPAGGEQHLAAKQPAPEGLTAHEPGSAGATPSGT